MANIKSRVVRLEAAAPMGAGDRITEIRRVIIGEFDEDGSPVILVRRISEPRYQQQ